MPMYGSKSKILSRASRMTLYMLIKTRHTVQTTQRSFTRTPSSAFIQGSRDDDYRSIHTSMCILSGFTIISSEEMKDLQTDSVLR